MIRAIQVLAWAIAFIVIPCDYVSADAADSSQVIPVLSGLARQRRV